MNIQKTDAAANSQPVDPRDEIRFRYGENPFEIARSWLKEAEQSEINDPNAIALSTVDADGMPNARMVLLKALRRKWPERDMSPIRATAAFAFGFPAQWPVNS